MQGADLVESIAGGTPTNDQVRALEAAMSQLPQPILPPICLAHGGVAARAVLIPAGLALTGCETNLDNVCIVLGDITVTTDDGPRRLTGFHMLPANRGTKRVGHAHADTWWVTCHHTVLTNQRDIEDEMTNESASLNSRRQSSIDALKACAEMLDGLEVPQTGRTFWEPATNQVIGGGA